MSSVRIVSLFSGELEVPASPNHRPRLYARMNLTVIAEVLAGEFVAGADLGRPQGPTARTTRPGCCDRIPTMS
jgi:hypothetical protein